MIDKLSFLTGGGDAGSVSVEEERLMQLFQNRAGLKKAYADLKVELHLLQDCLKQQEGSTTRIQERLDALGELLADPNSGFGALVFFQLRGLWKTSHKQLSAFAADLTRTQEQRETTKHTAECEALKRTRVADVDRRLGLAADKADLQRRDLAAAQNALTRLNAFWHYFERRRRQKDLESLRQAVTLADADVVELHAERNSSSGEPLAAFPGISLSARRNINLAIISYAELLCENVEAFRLATITREAVARRVHEMNFGGRPECEDYMQRVQKALVAVANQKQLSAALKPKLERLRVACDYRNSADTVPTADSLAAAGGADRLARGSTAAVWNVLADDYWDLYTLLLR